jgi:hypothetical protein
MKDVTFISRESERSRFYAHQNESLNGIATNDVDEMARARR